jgi:ATP-dependent RNA/DNA helicase IGHMBP2
MVPLRLDGLPRSVSVGAVLRFVCDTASLDAKHVGKITLQPRSADFELEPARARTAVAALDGATFNGRRVRCRYAALAVRQDHFARLAELLEREAAEERRRLTLAAGASADDPLGLSLRPLVLAEEDYGLGGRLLLTFRRKGNPGPLPPNRLGPGAPVVLTQLAVQRPAQYRGVVFDRAENSITAAFDDPDDDDDLPADATWRLDPVPDEAGRRRQAGAMFRAAAAEGDRLAELRDVLLGVSSPRLPEVGQPMIPSGGLNGAQEDAVALGLDATDFACLHGPPGTGKTTAVAELIRRAVARGETVLACGPSNAAVDNIVEKLLALGLEPVRLGHPARVAEAVRSRTLDLLADRHPDAKLARKRVREATAKFRKADAWTRGKPAPGEKAALRAEARQLLDEARELETAAVDKILAEARVIAATLTGVDAETLGKRGFDLAVIDEACQATEPAAWVPVLRARRIVFAGDPKQLPATVLSDEAQRGGLGLSLMERLMALRPEACRQLTVQYRMHERIEAVPDAEFYNNTLVAHETVAHHRLTELPGVEAAPATEFVRRFLDTAGAGYDDEPEADTGSRRNTQEAERAAVHVRALLAAGLNPAAIAVIAPYSGQVRVLRELLRETGVEVDSVDGFQGREAEAVVISWVRSNPAGELGFLADLRRANVALTRARRQLWMVGDSATLGAEPFFARLIAGCETAGDYATVWDC